MTPTSNTSKPSTASDTATGNNRWFRLGRPAPLPELDNIFDLYWGGPERRISRLTLRIIGINACALVMLLFGMIYLGQYQNILIEKHLQIFNSEIELVSASLAETVFATGPDGSKKILDADIAKRLAARLENTTGQQIVLFDGTGQKITESGIGWKEISAAKDNNDLSAIRILKEMTKYILRIFPGRTRLPLYPNTEHSQSAGDYPDTAEAFTGMTSMSVWQDTDENIVLSAASPLLNGRDIVGIVHLTKSGKDITYALGEMWLNIVAAFLITLILTTLLSIYLSNVIATPLRKLAQAAENMRRGRSRDTEIPDFSTRKDEIGELSIALRDMTHALWSKMDSIESFAADVAHELKNPLTSMRSAVETIAVVKKDDDRKKLLGIMQHDVERMDRLITDISNLSRLDTELSRETLEAISIKDILENIIQIHARTSLKNRHGNMDIRLSTSGPRDIRAQALSARIFQVFDNLVSNAMSFSPKDGVIDIHIHTTRKHVTVTISDQGPGIPPGKLETIFDRFYTERPQHEDYGRHSGLGLSICRQIITALDGRIFAENKIDAQGKVTGACFTVTLNSAPEAS